MAELVTAPFRVWWPVERLFAGYLAVVGLGIAIEFREVPEAAALLAAHVAAIALLAAAPRVPPAWQKAASVFRHWFPLAYIPLSYREMAILIPAIRRTDFDAQIARIDYRIWGAHISVWLERLQNPWATEFLQAVYTLYIPSVILVAAALWIKGLYPDFRYYAFLLSLGFLACYAGYFLVPVRGPRFYLAHLQHTSLQGVWLFEKMQHVLDRLESAHYDCFPSGHTAMTLIACWSSRRVSAKLFAGFTVYTILILSATVYLRYHYSIDLLAGAVLAAGLLAVAPKVYALALRANGESKAAGAGEPPAEITSTEVTN
jgi:membrane-associated phospholipid phosphatase